MAQTNDIMKSVKNIQKKLEQSQPTIKGLQYQLRLSIRKLGAANNNIDGLLEEIEDYKARINDLNQLVSEIESKLKQRDREMENSLKLQGDLDGKIKEDEHHIKILERQLDFKTKAIVRNDEQIGKLKSIVKLQSELL